MILHPGRLFYAEFLVSSEIFDDALGMVTLNGAHFLGGRFDMHMRSGPAADAAVLAVVTTDKAPLGVAAHNYRWVWQAMLGWCWRIAVP